MSLQKIYIDTIPHNININNSNTSNRILCFNVRTTVLIVTSIAIQILLTRTLQVDSFSVVPKVPLDGRKFDLKSNFKGEFNEAEEEETEKIKLLFGGVKTVTGKATYNIKKIAGASSANLKSAINSASTNTVSNIKSVSTNVEKGSKEVIRAIHAASKGASSGIKSGVSSIADKSSTDLKSAINSASTNTASNIKSVSTNVETGRKEVIRAINSASNVASSGIKSSVSNLNSIKTNAEEGSKEVITQLTSQAKNSTNIISTQAKHMVLQFTNKTKYEFGDITKELTNRLLEENTMQDTIILLKLLITVSATIAPLAKVLPIAILLDALNFSLERQVGGKLLEVLALSLDSRFTAALFTNDNAFQLGDIAKRSVIKAISSFTGKEEYSSGDISQAVKEQIDDDDDNISNSNNPDYLNSSTVHKKKLQLNFIANTEFEQWDRAFTQSPDSFDDVSYDNTNNDNDVDDEDIILRTTVDNIVRNEIDEWDAMFEKKYPSL